MRTLIVALTVLALAACSDDATGPDRSTPAGTYTLVTAADRDLPATFFNDFGAEITIESGSLRLTIRDISDELDDPESDLIGGDHTLRLRIGGTGLETETRTDSGLWAMEEDGEEVFLQLDATTGVTGDFEPGRIRLNTTQQLGSFGVHRLTFEK